MPGSSNSNPSADRRLRFYRRTNLALPIYNACILRTDERIVELEEEVDKLHRDIVGLSEAKLYRTTCSASGNKDNYEVERELAVNAGSQICTLC